MIIEVSIQKINPGKWEALDEIDKRYEVVESRHGFPSKTRLNSISGTHDSNTLLIVREWDNMATMEAAYMSAFEDPELQALNAEGASIVASSRLEFYMKR